LVGLFSDYLPDKMGGEFLNDKPAHKLYCSADQDKSLDKGSQSSAQGSQSSAQEGVDNVPTLSKIIAKLEANMELCRVQHGNFNPASEANGDNKLG
jgi:hypothetical protein